MSHQPLRPALPRLPAADQLEAALQERAKLDYTSAVVREAAQSTKAAVQRLRFALAAGGLAGRVVRSTRHLRRRSGDGSARYNGSGSSDDFGGPVVPPPGYRS